MIRLILLLICCQVAFSLGSLALAEDFGDCRVRCESEHLDCTNDAAAATEAEVQSAKMAACESKLQTCYAECENLKPVEPPTGTENNPNIITK
jgi:hypothetical protein